MDDEDEYIDTRISVYTCLLCNSGEEFFGRAKDDTIIWDQVLCLPWSFCFVGSNKSDLLFLVKVFLVVFSWSFPSADMCNHVQTPIRDWLLKPRIWTFIANQDHLTWNPQVPPCHPWDHNVWTFLTSCNHVLLARVWPKVTKTPLNFPCQLS